MDETISWFEAGAATHVGKVRRQNEDSFLVRPEPGIWAVADGMGGHAAGDVASQTVIAELSTIAGVTSAAELLASCEERIVRANVRLKDIADHKGGIVIGSTVAVLLTHHLHYACVWSGDSRIYRARGDIIDQLTIDHTEVQELVAKGQLTREEARTWPRRNVITRAIGVHDDPELEIAYGTLEPGDVFVICSDGLTGHVEDHEILGIVSDCPPQRACDRLVELTLDRGAADNVTVVVVRYDFDAPAVAPASPTSADIWE